MGLVLYGRGAKVWKATILFTFVFILLFQFLNVVLWLPVGGVGGGWLESDILFGSWQHHLEKKMKRDGDNTETHAFTHTSCWPVHPTLFIGQFRPGNLGPSKVEEKA